MRRAPGARTAVPAALLAGALLAACANPPSPAHRPGRTTTTQGATASASTTTRPAASSASPLQAGATVPVPITADAVTAAEAPDGAVFVSPLDPGSASPTVVWVVDRNGPAAVAETMPGGVAALAADATTLYVAGATGVTAFDRTTGNRDGHWSLPARKGAGAANGAAPLTMAASGGRVLVMISRGNVEDVYRFAPGSPAAPRLVAEGSSAAFGPDGSVAYARADNRLVEWRGTGAVTVGPRLADAPIGQGGGVQYVTAVADGLVWVSEPAGQGLDATMRTYDATTLAGRGGYDGTETEQVVGTTAGPLDLVRPGGRGACPQPSPGASSSCVFRIMPAGALTDPVPVGMAVTLLGPDPAVIVNGPSPTAFELERIT